MENRPGRPSRLFASGYGPPREVDTWSVRKTGAWPFQARLHDKGKPVARRGRKARGLAQRDGSAAEGVRPMTTTFAAVLGRSRTAITALAGLVAIAIVFALAQNASAAVATFAPVDRTPTALVFKIHGVEATSIRRAYAQIRQANGHVQNRRLSTRKVRHAAATGKLTVPVVKAAQGKGRVKGVTQDTSAPDTSITSGPAAGSSTTDDSPSFSFNGSDNVGVSSFDC